MRGHRTFWILVLALMFVLLGLTADAGEPVARYSLTNGWATFGLVVPQGAAKTGRSERFRARRARAHVLRHGELPGSWAYTCATLMDAAADRSAGQGILLARSPLSDADSGVPMIDDLNKRSGWALAAR